MLLDSVRTAPYINYRHNDNKTDTQMTLSENTQKELSRFEDWIIATDNVSRLENGKIEELHEEYTRDLYSFLGKISKDMRVGNFVLLHGTYGAKDEVAEQIYNTLNRG